ncbi:MAG: hydratase [Allorhizobium sp.]
MSHDPAAAFQPQHLADILLSSGERIAAATLPVPATMAQAMAVQALTAGAYVAGPIGYKVARSADGAAVIGRLLPLAIDVDGQAPAVFPWRRGARMEVEIAVRLETALPPRQDGYSRDAVISAIGSVHLGIEILDSRLEEGGKAPFLLFLADRLGNAGYVLGPELPKAALDTVGGMPLDISVGEVSIHAAPARHPADDVLAWLMDWACDLTRPQDTLSAGEILTTGSLCGALDVGHPGPLHARLGSLGEVRAMLVQRV